MSVEEARRIIRAWFPTLLFSEFEITSPPTKDYNCIAWAAGQEASWWWPDGRYWPDGIPKEESVAAFTQAYAELDYVPCETATLEPGLEKVALYVGADGRVLHAARQLADGRWTSKLGEAWDIIHDLEGLEGEAYGQVVRVLRRARSVADGSH